MKPWRKTWKVNAPINSVFVHKHGFHLTFLGENAKLQKTTSAVEQGDDSAKAKEISVVRFEVEMKGMISKKVLTCRVGKSFDLGEFPNWVEELGSMQAEEAWFPDD